MGKLKKKKARKLQEGEKKKDGGRMGNKEKTRKRARPSYLEKGDTLHKGKEKNSKGDSFN